MFGLHGKVKGKKIKFSRNALFLNPFSHFLRKKGEENLLPFPLIFFIVFFSSPFSMAFENEKTIFVSNFFPSFGTLHSQTWPRSIYRKAFSHCHFRLMEIWK